MYVRSPYVILFVRRSSWEPLIVYPLTVTKLLNVQSSLDNISLTLQK